jgi:hypothetical protein
METFETASAVTYEEGCLVLKIKAAIPTLTHFAILKGISVAMRESLFMEKLTIEERNGLAALGELATQLITDFPVSPPRKVA